MSSPSTLLLFGPGLTAGVVTGVVVSFAHTVLPTHWAPFVLTARARGWTSARLLAVAVAGALAHTLSTAVIGALAVAVGLVASAAFGALFETVAGAGLLLMGAAIVAQAFRAGHVHGQARAPRPSQTDRAAVTGLIVLMLVSPCEVALPVYLSAARYGWAGFCVLTAGVAAGTASGMLLAVFAARAGLERFRTDRWERYEGVALGAALMLLGVWILAAER